MYFFAVAYGELCNNFSSLTITGRNLLSEDWKCYFGDLIFKKPEENAPISLRLAPLALIISPPWSKFTGAVTLK